MLAVELACPDSAPFFGFMGVTAAVVFSNLGSGYGTAKSGVGLASMGVMKPEMVMRNVIPVVMAGIIGIYGLIVGVIITQNLRRPEVSYFNGFANLASGLCCGLSGLAAGMSIGVAGDAGVRANGQQPSLYVSMILVLIFGEALALYGLIVAIILSQSNKSCPT